MTTRFVGGSPTAARSPKKLSCIEKIVQARVPLSYVQTAAPLSECPLRETNQRKVPSLNPRFHLLHPPVVAAVFHLLHSSAPSSGRSRVLNPVQRTSVRQPHSCRADSDSTHGSGML